MLLEEETHALDGVSDAASSGNNLLDNVASMILVAAGCVVAVVILRYLEDTIGGKGIVILFGLALTIWAACRLGL